MCLVYLEFEQQQDTHRWCIFNFYIIRTLFLDFGPFITVFTVYIEVFKRQMSTLYLACLLAEFKNAVVTFP